MKRQISKRCRISSLLINLTFSPRFEHVWLESKKRLLDHVAQQPVGLKAGMRCALTVRRRSTSQSEPSAFLWNSFAKCSVSNRYAKRPEISSENRLCRSGQTCAK